jgi:KipI family sensor histidine kinase inhibitor
MIDLVPLGDRAWLARFGSEAGARAWAEAVGRLVREWPGVLDVVLAFGSVAVYADPERADLDALEAELRAVSAGAGEDGFSSGSCRTVEVPVLYDGEDLGDVARSLGLSVEEVQALHSGPTYSVWAVGFLPGFPYCGPLPGPLDRLARRLSPRPRVPAGSVAIAAGQTAIYPRSSPGGWHLIGRTPVVIADLEGGYFPIKAGDRVRFRAIDAETFRKMEGSRLIPS